MLTSYFHIYCVYYNIFSFAESTGFTFVFNIFNIYIYIY